MDADAIAELLALCVLCGVDHLAYVCVALIRDLQRELFRRLQAADLVLFLRVCLVPGTFGYHCTFCIQTRV